MAVDKTFLDVDVSNFHEDQLCAYAIVTHHLEVTLHGEDAEQLFMILTGEGGTGKITCYTCHLSILQILKCSGSIDKGGLYGHCSKFDWRKDTSCSVWANA